MKFKVNLGFPSLLGLAFIVLKLCKVISWSWFWVLSPIWLPVSLFLGIIFVVFVVFVVSQIIK